MQREIFITIEFSQMGIQVGPMGVKRSGGEGQKPRVSKAADLMGMSELGGETLTREYRLALTLSFAPSINFNYQIVGFDCGRLNDTDRNISNDETS